MFYRVVKGILFPILQLLWRPWADGIENVPRTGPAILACNHLSFADHFFGPPPRRVLWRSFPPGAAGREGHARPGCPLTRFLYGFVAEGG